MSKSYKYYGMKSSSNEVNEFVKHIIHTNELNEKDGRKKTPICIWGKHGIGKTDLVQQIPKELKYQWCYIAPAQFEEMGDLLGMPKIKEGVTSFVAPEWVPTKEGPGILLIDDVNRADDRILRGIMQLLQNFELVSWKLPPKWQIVLTANPDGGDYSVTTMDDAMLTRMMHITMEFNVKSWSKWAELNGVDPRGINFVLTYPEIVSGELTTPRSLVQFFNSIQTIKNLQEELPMVYKLAASCLDEETVSTFTTFVQQNLTKLIEPEKIIHTKQFERDVNKAIFEVVKVTSICLHNAKLAAIPKDLNQFKDLKVLDLSCNNIAKISGYFGQLKQLEELDLSMNIFETFPKQLLKMTQLRKIDFRNNRNKGFMGSLSQLDIPEEAKEALPKCEILS